MSRQPWDDVFDRIRVEKSSDYIYPFRPTAADLDAVEAELGCRLPASYRAFVKRFGPWGELVEAVRFYPLAEGVAPLTSVVQATRWWRMTYSEDRPVESENIALDFADQLVIFGDDFSDCRYAFYLGELSDSPRTECDIYKLDRMGQEEFQSRTLAGFITRVAEVVQGSSAEVGRMCSGNSLAFSSFSLQKSSFSKKDVRTWLSANTNAARNLASTIRDENRSDLFPILADALEDAGCDSVHVLRACRDGNVQADGEWVLAVLLGKNPAK